MYLYVWEEVEALEDHLPGMAFIHASTKTRAIKYVLKAVLKERNLSCIIKIGE